MNVPRDPVVTDRDTDLRKSRLLLQAAHALLAADDPNELLPGLFRQIREQVDVDTYIYFVVNDRADALQLASCEGIPAEEAAGIGRIELDEAICGLAALRRAPMVATHIQGSSDGAVKMMQRFGIRACVCHPLLCGDEVLGTLAFATHSRDAFDNDELEVLRTVSGNVAVAHTRLRLIAELREAERRKDEFLATLAHELRNPLAPIRSAVDFLRQKHSLNADQQHAADIIDRQLLHLTRLVDDLLDVSRVTLGGVELTKVRTTIGFVLGQAIEVSRPLIEAKRHTLTLELTPEPLYVEADPTRLAQVFVNLLNNAAKYTPTGGTIKVTASEEHGRVVVRVGDNGIGIPPQLLPEVFEPFRQISSSPAHAAGGGLGIGLTLARRLAELHGGEIEARSDGENRGADFVVRLPLARPHSRDRSI